MDPTELDPLPLLYLMTEAKPFSETTNNLKVAKAMCNTVIS
jgi:hypothetical protein